MTITPDVSQVFDPADWRRHRFGLSPERWAGLAGRGVWITGAGSGYGQALSVALASAGAQVFASGRRREKLLETRSAAVASGASADNVVPVPCDVTDPESVDAAARIVAAGDRPAFALINNAALPPPPTGPRQLSDADPGQWARVMATNVAGSWLTTRAIMPTMVKTGSARALFISSGAGWAFTPGFGVYNVSKAALNNLAASWAAEIAAAHPDVDVQINVLNPGEARTEMNQGSTVSPYAVVGMALRLLAQPAGGPNGRFFHRDGRHAAFCDAPAYPLPLEP